VLALLVLSPIALGVALAVRLTSRARRFSASNESGAEAGRSP